MCDEPTGWEERAFQPAQLLLAAGMDGQTIAVIGASHGVGVQQRGGVDWDGDAGAAVVAAVAAASRAVSGGEKCL